MLTPFGLQSRCGDESLKFQAVCPQSGTAVLKGIYAIAKKSCGGIFEIVVILCALEEGTYFSEISVDRRFRRPYHASRIYSSKRSGFFAAHDDPTRPGSGRELFKISRVGSGGFQALTSRAAPPLPDPTRSDPRGLTRPDLTREV